MYKNIKMFYPATGRYGNAMRATVSVCACACACVCALRPYFSHCPLLILKNNNSLNFNLNDMKRYALCTYILLSVKQKRKKTQMVHV